jgi:hypothetical protein
MNIELCKQLGVDVTIAKPMYSKEYLDWCKTIPEGSYQLTRTQREIIEFIITRMGNVELPVKLALEYCSNKHKNKII